MKRALVLGGGGAKGAYEIGVWKALNELGEQFDLVCGTSIGALIGAMYVQHDYERCAALWERLQAADIIKNGVNIQYDLEQLMEERKAIKEMISGYVTNKGVDISPFEQMIETLFDEERFFTSDIDFGCMCVLAKDLSPYKVKKQMMTPTSAKDYLLASASCFPIFPMKEMEGNKYIDGGYYDNVPATLALEMGADSVLAIDLKPADKKKKRLASKKVTYLSPREPLGSFLDFSRERIYRNQMLGYFDTMKLYRHYIGERYTFPASQKQKIEEFEEKMVCFFNSKKQSDHVLAFWYHQLFQSNRKNKRKQEGQLQILEKSAALYEVDDLQVYDFDTFLNEIERSFHSYQQQHEEMRVMLPSMIKEAKSFSKKEATLLFYRYLVHRYEPQESNQKQLPRLLKEPLRYAMCLYYVIHQSDHFRFSK